MQKGQMQVLILAGAVLLIALTGGVFFLGRVTAPKSQPPVITSFPQPSPTPDATVYTESDRSANWKIYTNTKAKYSFKYPDNVKIYINEKFSVDGVRVPLKDTVMLLSDALPGLNTNYQMSINHRVISGNINFDEFIKSDQCIQTPNTGQEYTLDGRRALLFMDTVCGPYGITLIYAINNGMGYIFGIETRGSYSDIKKYIDQILSTFKFTD